MLHRKEKSMEYIHSWSGGKDSTASIILDYIHNDPPIAKKIIFSEVMFDKERGISGEHPEHIEWINTIAIPRLKTMGFEVIKARADKDYLDCFFSLRKKSQKPENVGKYYGFPLAKGCHVNREVKMGGIKKANEIAGKAIQIIGIAIDEPERLSSMHSRKNQISLLEKYGYTEAVAFKLCEDWGMLSPTYRTKSRGGCWFCPNARIAEMAELKDEHPELWAELEKLSHIPNTISRGFKWGESFACVDQRVDQYLRSKWMKENQMKWDV